MFKRISCILASLTILLSFNYSDAQTYIAVLEFLGKNVPEAEASALTDRLRIELFRTKRFKVLERELMDRILKEQGFQLAECTSDECIIEMGQLIGVEQVVAGSVSRVGDVYSVAARIVSVETAEIERIATYDYEGKIGYLLKIGMEMIANELAKDDLVEEPIEAVVSPVEPVVSEEDQLEEQQYVEAKEEVTETIEQPKSIKPKLPSAISRNEIGLISGIGLTNSKEGLDYKRYRFLLGGSGLINLIRQDEIIIGMGVDGEFSFGMYNYEDDYFKDVVHTYFMFLTDLFPEISLNFSDGIKLGFGTGLSFGTTAEIFLDEEWDYEMTTNSSMFGFNLKPSLTFGVQNFFVRGIVKYRYLSDNTTWVEIDRGYEDSGDFQYNDQSWDIILSVCIGSGRLTLEGGIQAENWVYKHEDWDKWPKWPEAWEYMLIGKLSFNF